MGENKKRDGHFYRALFWSTFWISALTVGGGFVIISLLKAKYVDEFGWLDDKETLDLAALAQSMPGVMAVNASILLGYRMAGIAGALTALTATILPPLITLSLIAQAKVKGTYAKMSKINNSRGLTGAQAAMRVLSYYGVTGVQISVNGSSNLMFMDEISLSQIFVKNVNLMEGENED